MAKGDIDTINGDLRPCQHVGLGRPLKTLMVISPENAKVLLVGCERCIEQIYAAFIEVFPAPEGQPAAKGGLTP